MALDTGELDLLRDTIRDAVESAVESAQEKLAQMVAKQFVEIRAEIQDVRDAVRKMGTRQIQVEADLAEVGRNCELLKRRMSDLHDGLGTADRVIQDREFALRLDHLEREISEIRSRLPVV